MADDRKPPPPIAGDGATEEKKPKRALPVPAEATFGERLLACARRLYTGKNKKGETVCYLSWHHRRPPRTSQEIELLMLAICAKLLPTQLEFRPGSGSKPGSKHGDRESEDDLLQGSKHRRTLRDKQERERA
jgi:hypothetical protein